jgi:CO dehydrogenase/acetyl-CoA synthase alpha subunit
MIQTARSTMGTWATLNKPKKIKTVRIRSKTHNKNELVSSVKDINNVWEEHSANRLRNFSSRLSHNPRQIQIQTSKPITREGGRRRVSSGFAIKNIDVENRESLEKWLLRQKHNSDVALKRKKKIIMDLELKEQWKKEREEREGRELNY